MQHDPPALPAAWRGDTGLVGSRVHNAPPAHQAPAVPLALDASIARVVAAVTRSARGTTSAADPPSDALLDGFAERLGEAAEDAGIMLAD